jgi:hypothetical protein
MWSDQRGGCSPYLKAVRFDQPAPPVEEPVTGPDAPLGLANRVRQALASFLRT